MRLSALLPRCRPVQDAIANRPGDVPASHEVHAFNIAVRRHEIGLGHEFNSVRAGQEASQRGGTIRRLLFFMGLALRPEIVLHEALPRRRREHASLPVSRMPGQAANVRSIDNRIFYARGGVLPSLHGRYFAASIICKCIFSVGSVFAAKLFRSESVPDFASVRII